MTTSSPAAEGRAGGPTAGEIEAAARAFETHNPPYDTTTAAEFRSGRATAALAAALPLIEARLREPADRVRALHMPREEWLSPFSNKRGLQCTHCRSDDWPCPTIRALDGPS